MVADPVPSVSTGGTSWEPSSVAVQLLVVVVVEYAASGLANDMVPITNNKLNGIENVLSFISNKVCFLLIRFMLNAAPYYKILKDMCGIHLKSQVFGNYP